MFCRLSLQRIAPTLVIMFICWCSLHRLVFAQLLPHSITQAQETLLRQLSGNALPPLADLEAYSLRYHPALRIARSDVAQAQQDIVTAGLRPNPVIAVQKDIFPWIGEAFAPAQKQYGFQLNVPFELGGKRDYRIALAEQATQAVRLQVANSARLLLLAVRLAYFDVLSAQEYSAIADTTVSIYRTLVDLNALRLNQQQIAANEYTRSRIALDQALLQQRETQLALRKARIALLSTLGISADSSLARSPQNTSVPRQRLEPIVRTIPSLDSLRNQTLRNRHDLLLARAVQRTAGANQELQEANASIDITVGLDAYIQQGVFIYGLTTQIPLPFFSRNQGEREKSRLRADQAEQSFEYVRRSLLNEIEAAAAEYEVRAQTLRNFSAQAGIANRDDILARALSMRTVAELSYKSGSISLLELLDALRTHQDILRSYIDALTQYNKSIVQLDAVSASDTIIIE